MNQLYASKENYLNSVAILQPRTKFLTITASAIPFQNCIAFNSAIVTLKRVLSPIPHFSGLKYTKKH